MNSCRALLGTYLSNFDARLSNGDFLIETSILDGLEESSSRRMDLGNDAHEQPVLLLVCFATEVVSPVFFQEAKVTLVAGSVGSAFAPSQQNVVFSRLDNHGRDFGSYL